MKKRKKDRSWKRWKRDVVGEKRQMMKESKES